MNETREARPYTSIPLDLPQELLVRISRLLTVPALGNLRRTCKHVEMFLYNDFVREFFTKRQFMLEEPSLQALVGISNHANLSGQVREIIIGLQRYVQDPDCRSQPAKDRYKLGYVSHEVLLSTGKAHDMLVEAFSKLPHLRTVCLRDYDARGRLRGGNPYWKSYGWTLGPLDRISPDTVFSLVVHALGRAGATPDTLAAVHRKGSKLTAASFNFLDGYMLANVRPVLAGLRGLTLTLAVKKPSATLRSIGTSSAAEVDNDMNCTSLKRLMHELSSLENLRLNFMQMQSLASGFLAWFGSSASVELTTTIPPVTMSNLTTLELGKLDVAPSTLLRVVAKFNVRSLSLWEVALHCENYGQIRSQPTRWECLLMDISELPLTCLSSVLIGKMSQIADRSDAEPSDTYANAHIFFTREHDSKELPNMVTYDPGTGLDVKHWFSLMSSRTTYDLEVLSLHDVEITSESDE